MNDSFWEINLIIQIELSVRDIRRWLLIICFSDA